MRNYHKSILSILPWLLLSTVLGSTAVLAEPNNGTADRDYLLDYNGSDNAVKNFRNSPINWEKKRIEDANALQKKITDQSKVDANNLNKLYQQELQLREKFKKNASGSLGFNSTPSDTSILNVVLGVVGDLLLPANAEAATTNYGDIILNGDLSDWNITQRLNLPLEKPPYLEKFELYGKYVTSPTPSYVIAIKVPTGKTIGANTTLWINADQNANTGFPIYTTPGLGGIEFCTSIKTVGSGPTLFSVPADPTKGYCDTLTTPLAQITDFAYSADKSVLEYAIPAAALFPNATPKAINLLGDINDDNALYFPAFYSSNIQYTLPLASNVLPKRTDASKRVGIVFSETSQSRFYYTPGTLKEPDQTTIAGKKLPTVAEQKLFLEKNYAQLVMAMQHQAMMAGLSYDLLSENDLTDINKLANYDALVIPYMDRVLESRYAQIRKNLYLAQYGLHIGIISAGDLMVKVMKDGYQKDDPDYDAPHFSINTPYEAMQQLLYLTREGGIGPFAVNLTANNVSHPAMKGYTAGESILSGNEIDAYKYFYSSYYTPVAAAPELTTTTLVNQNIPAVGNKPATLAIENAGTRNVHFATEHVLGDTSLVWQALQWVVYGKDNLPVSLKMGRNNNLFVSRNDMDQSKFYNITDYLSMGYVDAPLVDKLKLWKETYNFVGSYYINIGSLDSNVNFSDEKTVWTSNPPPTCDTSKLPAQCDSKPLYERYKALGNEIGTHSYSHPNITYRLPYADYDSGQKFGTIQQEFQQSMDEIGQNLNPTWQNLNFRGGAVPGAPETTPTSQAILQSLDYLSGGASVIGAGFPSAFGYLTPEDSRYTNPNNLNDTNVYLSPNLTFDFTLIEFGIPLRIPGSNPVAYTNKILSPVEAGQYWLNEYSRLNKHASQPIIHWPWHDYAATICSDSSKSLQSTGCGGLYSLNMFTGLLAQTQADNGEFITGADISQRIKAFKESKLLVTQTGNQITATVSPSSTVVGKFAIALNLPSNQVIQKVSNWYAYNNDKVFLSQTGGSFNIQTGASADNATHITALPMRSKLLSLSGNGSSLTAKIEGEGEVVVALNGPVNTFKIASDGGILRRISNTSIGIKFSNYDTHEIRIDPITTDLIVNGSFEEPATNTYTLANSIIGWCGKGDQIEFGPAAVYGVAKAAGSTVVELDANRNGSNTGIYQYINTPAAQPYVLTLDVAARSGTALSTNSVEVWWRGSKIATIDPKDTSLTSYSFNVTTSGDVDLLELREQTGDDDTLGGMLDNIRLTPGTVSTSLIVNGSFEQPNAGSYGLYSSIPGWVGTGDKIELSTATAFGVTGADGVEVLELDANKTTLFGSFSFGRYTGIVQTVTTQAKNYTLSLKVAARQGFLNGTFGRNTNTVEVWWRNSRVAVIDPTTTTLTTYSYTVAGSGGADKLEFREQSGDDDSVGGIIDNVVLQ